MISEGLLWFDDDARRPLASKISDALERYRDRVGYEPTVCLVNPAQEEALRAPAPARSRVRRGARSDDGSTLSLPPSLQIQPSEALSTNYFMIGVAAGETPRPAVGRPSAEEEYMGSHARSPRANGRSGTRGTDAAARPAVGSRVAPGGRQRTSGAGARAIAASSTPSGTTRRRAAKVSSSAPPEAPAVHRSGLSMKRKSA
jgi:hypothetical protein